MSTDSNYSKHAILFIDDEEQSQKYFSQIFGRIFKIYLASDAEEGLKLFEEFRDEIGVVVSDQRMPGMPGSELLAQIAEDNPDVVNILSTAYSDLDAAIDAVNKGGIYRYVTKPWDLAELEVTLRRAMDYYQLKEQHGMLARMKISGLERMFHQSRLLACLAIPALLESGPSAVRAFRDLLRLSLEQEKESDQGAFSGTETLSATGRQELSERVKGRLGQVMELLKSGEGLTPERIEALNIELEERDGETRQSLATQALILLLQGQATDREVGFLADLLKAYQDGYEIRPAQLGWQLIQSETPAETLSAQEEIYSLFVDDSFLVSLALGELQ